MKVETTRPVYIFDDVTKWGRKETSVEESTLRKGEILSAAKNRGIDFSKMIFTTRSLAEFLCVPIEQVRRWKGAKLLIPTENRAPTRGSIFSGGNVLDFLLDTTQEVFEYSGRAVSVLERTPLYDILRLSMAKHDRERLCLMLLDDISVIESSETTYKPLVYYFDDLRKIFMVVKETVLRWWRYEGLKPRINPRITRDILGDERGMVGELAISAKTLTKYLCTDTTKDAYLFLWINHLSEMSKDAYEKGAYVKAFQRGALSHRYCVDFKVKTKNKDFLDFTNRLRRRVDFEMLSYPEAEAIVRQAIDLTRAFAQKSENCVSGKYDIKTVLFDGDMSRVILCHGRKRTCLVEFTIKKRKYPCAEPVRKVFSLSDFRGDCWVTDRITSSGDPIDEFDRLQTMLLRKKVRMTREVLEAIKSILADSADGQWKEWDICEGVRVSVHDEVRRF